VFSLLYMPCVAAMAAVKREMGGWISAILVMTFQTVTAWIVAVIFYQIGSLLFS
jgi:ferrous iron transport protein B